MGYDWEFDGSVNFAPLDYRKEKYKEVEKIGNLMDKKRNEATAVDFLKRFAYIKYLHNNVDPNEIWNWDKLLEYEELALSLLKSKEAIFKWVLYPRQSKMWREEFDYLRDTESNVKTEEDTYRYMSRIYKFNVKIREINKNNNKYNIAKHTLYWVQSYALKDKIRKLLKYDHMDKDDKIVFLKTYGVLENRDYYGGR